jgi:hypothetical protein
MSRVLVRLLPFFKGDEHSSPYYAQYMKGHVISLLFMCGLCDCLLDSVKPRAIDMTSPPPLVNGPCLATHTKVFTMTLDPPRYQCIPMLFILVRSCVSSGNCGLCTWFRCIAHSVCPRIGAHCKSRCCFSRRRQKASTRQKAQLAPVAKQNGERQQPPTQRTLPPCLFTLFVCLYAMQAKKQRKKGPSLPA